jgi:hypothetical protein
MIINQVKDYYEMKASTKESNGEASGGINIFIPTPQMINVNNFTMTGYSNIKKPMLMKKPQRRNNRLLSSSISNRILNNSSNYNESYKDDK